MLDRLEFLTNEAFIALRRNSLMTFAAISTVAVSLFLLGVLTYAYLQAADYARSIPGRFDMRVHLRMGADRDEIKDTAAQIRAIPGVKDVAWIPRDKQWALEQQKNPSLTAGLDNPYPDAFKVTINDLKQGPEIEQAIRNLKSVDTSEKGVVYLRQEQRLVEDSLRLFRLTGLTVGLLLTITAWILIYNAIRMTIQSRRLEIRIMQLVGASRLTVELPFLFEGIVQGLIGGLIASALMYASYMGFGQLLVSVNPIATMPPFPAVFWTFVLAAVGVLYGLVCSVIAVRRPLRYR